MALFGLTQKINRIVEWNKLGSQLANLQSVIEEYQKDNPMNQKEVALNAGKHFLYTSASLGLMAIVAHWADPVAVNAFMTQHFSATVAIAATPIVKAAFVIAEKFLIAKLGATN